ncbi:MAG: energy transducer TonB [Flavobacteriaceae bacterium]|nr:energy transducer TonB [Flavobacteriaceae bacterium]
MRSKMVYILLLCCVVVNVYGQRKFVEPPTLVCGPISDSNSPKITTKPCKEGEYKEAVYPHGDDALIALFKKAFDFDTKEYTEELEILKLVTKFDVTVKGELKNIRVWRGTKDTTDFRTLESEKEKELAKLVTNTVNKIGLVEAATCNNKKIKRDDAELVLYINDASPLVDHIYLSSTLFASSDSFPKGMNSREPDVEASYEGGIDVFHKKFSREFKMPDVSEDVKSIRIVVSFVIEKDGSLSNITVLKDPGYGTAKEVLRVLRKLGNWKPAMYKEEPLRSKFTYPINLQYNL